MKIAFFDFDGTVTKKDSLLEFIKFQKGLTWFYFGFVLHSPILIAYKLGIISNQTAKERILRFFFGKTPIEQFQQGCDDFAKHELAKMVRSKALYEIRQLREKGFQVVLVSASASNWLRSWSQQNNLQLIATELEVSNNRITGRILGKNCYGKEKVNRIKSLYKLDQYNVIYCYGDTKGDIPMLELGTIKFYKPFR